MTAAISGVKTLFRQAVEELCGCEAEERMAPGGFERGHGTQHKRAQMHPRMWQGEFGSDGDSVADGYEVDVHEAIGICSVGIAVGSCGNASFNFLKSMQELKRPEVGVEGYSEVDEAVSRHESPRFAFLRRSPAHLHAEEVRNSVSRATHCRTAVAEIGAYVDVSRHRVFLTSTSSKASMMSPSLRSL